MRFICVNDQRDSEVLIAVADISSVIHQTEGNAIICLKSTQAELIITSTPYTEIKQALLSKYKRVN